MPCGRSAVLEFRPFWAATAACSALATATLPAAASTFFFCWAVTSAVLSAHDPLLRRRHRSLSRQHLAAGRGVARGGRGAQLAVQLSQSPRCAGRVTRLQLLERLLGQRPKRPRPQLAPLDDAALQAFSSAFSALLA